MCSQSLPSEAGIVTILSSCFPGWRPAAWEALDHLLFTPLAAWNLKPALVLWQRGNLMPLEDSRSHVEGKSVSLVAWPAVSGDPSILPNKQRPQGRCGPLGRYMAELCDLGEQGLPVPNSHLQGVGVEVCVFTVGCQQGSGASGPAMQVTSICVSLAPDREWELVVQSGQTQMALIQLSHAQTMSFFVGV